MCNVARNTRTMLLVTHAQCYSRHTYNAAHGMYNVADTSCRMLLTTIYNAALDTYHVQCCSRHWSCTMLPFWCAFLKRQCRLCSADYSRFNQWPQAIPSGTQTTCPVPFSLQFCPSIPPWIPPFSPVLVSVLWVAAFSALFFFLGGGGRRGRGLGWGRGGKGGGGGHKMRTSVDVRPVSSNGKPTSAMACVMLSLYWRQYCKQRWDAHRY